MDKKKRLAYAEHGHVSTGGGFGCVTLNSNWEIRKKEIGWLDDKPWWLDSSSANNRYYYDFDDGDGPPETLDIEKHSPHFMNLCGVCWKGKVFSFDFKSSI